MRFKWRWHSRHCSDHSRCRHNELQEKLKAEANQYTGEQTQEAAFEILVMPVAKETGLHFTWEEYREYLEQRVQQLDLSEMDQVAAGSSYGFGAFGCAIVGLGAGGGGGDWTGGACLAVGLGTGALSCLVNGVSTCQSPGNRG